MSEEARSVHGTFDGAPIEAPEGASVAAALIGSGRTSWRTTPGDRPRGLFCGIGVCFDCIVEIDGESGQRACMIPLRDGMEVRPACGAGAADPADDLDRDDGREQDDDAEDGR